MSPKAGPYWTLNPGPVSKLIDSLDFREQLQKGWPGHAKAAGGRGGIHPGPVHEGSGQVVLRR